MVQQRKQSSGLGVFRKIIERAIVRGFFDRKRPIVVTRAPGRLDLMGGIADYSGSLVLQYPIRKATFAAAQISGDRKVRIESIPDRHGRENFVFEAGLDEFAAGEKLGSVADARRYFSAAGSDIRWAAYAAGALVVLAEALDLHLDRGLRVLIRSDVPRGKGVSSSAALEVSAMKAVADAYAVSPAISCRDLALLCQRVENEIVGAPCGVMDQMVSACGGENELLEILCQPAELLGAVKLPREVEIWGIDSGIKHSVAGADYGTVRTAASMGYRIIAGIAGLSVDEAGPGRVEVSDPKWNGYLANIDAKAFRETFESELPASVDGGEFVSTFYGVSDPFAKIDPSTLYPVRAAAAHPVYESERVRRFSELLKGGGPDLEELGALMYGSHESYSACGLGSDGTDRLVELVKKAGPASGLFGAKITGGGSGGTVAVLGRNGSAAAVDGVAAEYRKLTGRRPRIFAGSSPGAYAFGPEVVQPGS